MAGFFISVDGCFVLAMANVTFKLAQNPNCSKMTT